MGRVSIANMKKNDALSHLILNDLAGRDEYCRIWNVLDGAPGEMKGLLILRIVEEGKMLSKDSAVISGILSEMALRRHKLYDYTESFHNNYVVFFIRYSVIDIFIDTLIELCEEKRADYYIGIGSPFNDVSYFSIIYSEALDAIGRSNAKYRVNSFRKDIFTPKRLLNGTGDRFWISICQELIEALDQKDFSRFPEILPRLFEKVNQMDHNTAFNICIEMLRTILEHFGLDTYEDYQIKYRFDLFCNEDNLYIAFRTTFIDNLLRIFALLNSVQDNGGRQAVRKSKNIVESHYSDPNLSLLDIANALGVSYNYLSSCFKQYANSSFVDYLTSVRMNQAVKMLGQGDHKVAEIAQAVGYNSSGYFITVFKKKYNLSPNDYKKRMR
ncbi:MAG TPA: helix-turn-helix transcriptional regulator [Clostridiales bacterium]|nr:helix-turn-helix transcriptional regulator [Clostridiales bacterium]